MSTVATMRKDFQDFSHHAYAYPTSLATLLFFCPFAYSFPFCFSLLIAYNPQCICYLLNVKPLLIQAWCLLWNARMSNTNKATRPKNLRWA